MHCFSSFRVEKQLVSKSLLILNTVIRHLVKFNLGGGGVEPH